MRLQFIASEVAQGLRRNLSMVVSIILVTFVSLAFVGAAALLRQQVDSLKGQWYDLVEVTVDLCPRGSLEATCATGEATDATIADVRNTIDTELGHAVSAVYFESKEQRFDDFMADHQDGVFEGTQLTADDMQAAFRLQLNDPEKFEVVSNVLTGRDGVENVWDQRAVFQPLFTALNRGSLLAAGLAVVMLTTAALLISTTIRLSAVSRRRETGIMKLVGASNTVIQLPFLLEGVIAAVTGALLAAGGLWLAVRYVITDWLAQSVSFVSYVNTGNVVGLLPLLVGIAAALALVSSVVSLSRHTRV
ncbi:MAG: permease-like cell division protein FtsX [Cellulomonadaceae bacterium]|jgi:cell division transport system permease protein|nr:permease-like cell division protein FtsX [Cellulomonadaceae bacterium]